MFNANDEEWLFNVFCIPSISFSILKTSSSIDFVILILRVSNLPLITLDRLSILLFISFDDAVALADTLSERLLIAVVWLLLMLSTFVFNAAVLLFMLASKTESFAVNPFILLSLVEILLFKTRSSALAFLSEDSILSSTLPNSVWMVSIFLLTSFLLLLTVVERVLTVFANSLALKSVLLRD